MTTEIQDERATDAMAIHSLAALQQRIEHRMQERHHLAEAFDALAGSIRTALADGRSPLAQIGELDQLNHRIQQLEGEIAVEMEKAAKKFFTLSDSEHGLAMLSVKAKTLKTAK